LKVIAVKHVYFLLIILVIGCSSDTIRKKLILQTLNKESVDLTNQENAKLSIYYFASPDCPLSNEYCYSMNKLLSTNNIKDSIKVFFVFCGNLYSNNEIADFVSRNKINSVVLLDKDYSLQKLLKAKVTPEVFVVQSNFNVLYNGSIDNKYISVKEKRRQASEFYLNDAVEKVLKNEKPTISYVKPIGCFIE
jgi:AhpC/TSA family